MQALIMSLRKSLVAIAILAIAGFAAFYPQTDPKEKEQFIIQAVISALEGMHYAPKDINDDFSAKLFEEYLDEMDAGKRFLTAESIARLEPYRLQLDDQIKAMDPSFFNLSVQLLEEGLDKAEAFYDKHKDGEFDFTVEETYELDEEKRPWPANDEELEEYWRKTIKYEILIRLDEKKNADDDEGKSMEEQVEEARKQVVKIFDDWFERNRKLRRDD